MNETLTDKQTAALINALRVAADVYKTHARDLATIPGPSD